ncbi:hypothetical protein ACJX0J_011680, partial [Zea mays]
ALWISNWDDGYQKVVFLGQEEIVHLYPIVNMRATPLESNMGTEEAGIEKNLFD